MLGPDSEPNLPLAGSLLEASCFIWAEYGVVLPDTEIGQREG